MSKVLGVIKGVAYALFTVIPLALLVFAFIKGIDWFWDNVVNLVVVPAFIIVLAVTLCIFLPLCAIKKIRAVGGVLMAISSYVLSALLWLFCLGVIWVLWGMVWTIVGLCLAIIGVAPMAFLATLFSGSWAYLIIIVIAGLIVCGGWALSAYFIDKSEKEAQ